MHESFLRALLTQRAALRQRWEALLRAERVTSPLANPDALVYLMDWTLDRLFDELRTYNARRRGRNHRDAPPCPCGRNPLLTYFSTAEQAIVETLFLAEGELALLDTMERGASLDELKIAFHHVSRREIQSFCAVCQLQQEARPPAGDSAAIIPMPV